MRVVKLIAFAFLGLFAAESASAQVFHRRQQRYVKHHNRRRMH